MANDVFTDIAAKGIGGRSELLTEPKPPKINRILCSLEGKKSEPLISKKLSYTKDELMAELSAERERMKPYLVSYAPKIHEYSTRQYINKFTLNNSDTVSIPHYGAPIGYNLYTYDASFRIEKKEEKAYYMCFDGADYYAVVYINGVCIGTHEGFFSPFEFDMTNVVKSGENTLRIELYNDYIYGGNAFADQEQTEGDKLYAATGLGWDDAAEGWHHCPAGTGIYNKVYFEERNPIHISDIFVRPNVDNQSAEAWIEVNHSGYKTTDITFSLSLYGQNFESTIFENKEYVPETIKTVGMGDSLTESMVRDQLGHGIPMPVKHGKNIYKLPVKINNPKLWEPSSPYLYQLQVQLKTDNICDEKKCSFGMRSFTQDINDEIKGMFYLNGRKIRLRGANTMGFEQQDVLRGDFNQLIDDILLAKLCNMNFWRLTQRPVQDEIYEYCDMLGLMTQTDLPLFGCMRRNKFCEGVRQAEEMERIVRKHPCNVIISYINEPFPNASNEPHRHLTRDELEGFFAACDTVVHLSNPDRVIKHVDGDYDPPTDSMPDNHCYPMWYNGHGIDIGRLNKGYWLPVKPGWYYGCGEYGAEGLDFCEVMRECYPKEWIKEPFNPSNIVRAQTGNMHYFFFDGQDSMEEWVKASQSFQAFATKLMTEAFRRNNYMISNAIHLFIDAWPSGWMKTIMDCRRNPKKAYFAYRDALSPVLVSLRTDKFAYYAGEEIHIECFICNDTSLSGDNYSIVYELYRGKNIVKSATQKAKLKECEAAYSSEAVFTVNDVNDRECVRLRAVLIDSDKNVISENSISLNIFEDTALPENNDVIIINPAPGTHEIAGSTVNVKPCGMLPVHFASRKTGHKYVEEFMPNDFSYWYDKTSEMITPIAENTFTADGFTPILTGGNQDENGNWVPVMICGEKIYNGKKYVVCTADLRTENPVAKRFLKNILM